MTRPHYPTKANCSPQHLGIALLFALLGMLPLHATENMTAPVIETSHKVPLSSGQTLALSRLERARPEHPAPLILFTDPNKDPDDLIVLVQTKYLQEHAFLDLRCVLATLGDDDARTMRARFAKHVLDDLGLGNVKVGVGMDYGFEVKDSSGDLDTEATEGRKHDHRVFIDTPLLAPLTELEMDGFELLKEELQRLPDHSAIWLINSGMADAAKFFMRAPDLVQRKTSRVVIMGGVEPRVDERGFVVADKRAYNNTTHQPSADYLYARVQELGIPLVVVNKEAAYATAVPRSFYDGMAATGNPIGIYLKNQQKDSLSHLWEGIHKGHLPPALTATWFFKTFTDVNVNSAHGRAVLDYAEAHVEDFEIVWHQVSKFNLYDPLALLAATPGATELAFRGATPANATSNIQVIGKRSIKDSVLVKDLLTGLGIASLNGSWPDISDTSELGATPR